MAAKATTSVTYLNGTIFMVSTAVQPDEWVVYGRRGDRQLTQHLKGDWLNEATMLAISLLEVFVSMQTMFVEFEQHQKIDDWGIAAQKWEEKVRLPDWLKGK